MCNCVSMHECVCCLYAMCLYVCHGVATRVTTLPPLELGSVVVLGKANKKFFWGEIFGVGWLSKESIYVAVLQLFVTK